MESEGHYSGYKLNRWAPSISHTMFADDVMLYGTTDTRTINSISSVLHQYYTMSGQLVNYTKSSIYFSKSVPESYAAEIIQKLGVKQMPDDEKYLGIKILQQGKRVSNFNYLVEKFDSALSGRKKNNLSHAGRTVLIQSVLALIPVYFMATSMIPKGILDKLTRIIRDFWWGHSRDKRKMHFLNWDWFKIDKEKGGLGLRSLYDLNLALVAKLSWRFLQEQDSLWAQVLKAKYIRNISFWKANKTQYCSSTWSAMLECRSELRKGCQWLVGNGERINILTDPWIPTIQGATPILPGNDTLMHTKVSDLLDSHTGQWNIQALNQLEDPYIISHILRIVPNPTAEDKLIWRFTNHGNFTPQSFQKMYKDQHGESSIVCENPFPWRKLWATKRVAPKIKMFIWRALQNALAVSQRIGKYVTGVSTLCSICLNEEESVDHLLLHCDLARASWFASTLGLRIQGDNQLTLPKLMELLLERNDNDSSLTMGMCLCWAIWKARNERVFDNKTATVDGILRVAAYWYNLYYNYTPEEDDPLPFHHQDIEDPIQVSWSAPTHPNIKINVDAAWKDGRYACAAIARNSEGLCVGAGTRLGWSDTVVFAEADGFCLATDLALWLHLDHITIEGDNQSVVRSLKNENQHTPWRIWRLKDEINRKMTSLNSAGSFKFVPKPANSAAHSLAAFAFNHNVQDMWTSDNIPASIVGLWNVDNN